MSVRAATVAVTAVLGVGFASADALSAQGSEAFACPLSSSNHPRPSFSFGNSRIAVGLPPRATFVAVPDGKSGWAFVQRDGWIRTKIGWWTARGVPRVTGRRLDRRARPLRVDMGPLSWASPGGEFYPSLLYFPSVGCWRITATAGGARLVAVVRVVRR